MDRATPPAWLTVPLAALYGLGAAWDARRQTPARAFRPPVPVISVGNLAVGGTGKTPCVMALGRLLLEIEPALARPNVLAILSRGYGRESRDLVVVEADMDYRQCGDEPLLIKHALPHAAVVVQGDRRQAARYAVERLGARVLLLDDGFQHRKLARDLDLVLVDGESPLGNGRLLPAGPLRERPEALARASLLVSVGTAVEGAARLAASLGKPFVQAVPRLSLPPELATGKGTPVFVLTAIARPSRFYRMLEAKGLTIKGELAFRDHHRFTATDMTAATLAAQHCGAVAVVTTAKDRLRLGGWPGELPLSVAELTVDFSADSPLRDRLQEWVGKAMKVNEK